MAQVFTTNTEIMHTTITGRMAQNSETKQTTIIKVKQEPALFADSLFLFLVFVHNLVSAVVCILERSVGFSGIHSAA